jgi:hypothetical protein
MWMSLDMRNWRGWLAAFIIVGGMTFIMLFAFAFITATTPEQQDCLISMGDKCK